MIEWSAGFLPRQGSATKGIGFQEEKAPCIRTFEMGGVLVKRQKNAKQVDDSKSVGCGEPQGT